MDGNITMGFTYDVLGLAAVLRIREHRDHGDDEQDEDGKGDEGLSGYAVLAFLAKAPGALVVRRRAHRAVRMVWVVTWRKVRRISASKKLFVSTAMLNKICNIETSIHFIHASYPTTRRLTFGANVAVGAPDAPAVQIRALEQPRVR